MSWRLPLWLLTPSDLAFRRWRLEFLIDTAVSCGLRVADSSTHRALHLKVEARSELVTVHIKAPGSPESGIRIMAVFRGPPDFSSVRIRRLASVPPWTRDLESGDELFDGAFSIEGPVRLLRVLLDAEMRRLLVSVKAEWLEISRGELRLETSDEALADVLPLLLEISRRLAQRVDPAQRLAENARRDPEAGVRLRNLLLLAREFPEDPETIHALCAACLDASPQVRLKAAVALGADGRDVLLELAESTEGRIDDALSEQAVVSLGRELPFERSRAILSSALRRRRLQTARACLELLGRCGDAAAVNVLAKVLAREQGELAAAAALALGETGSTAAEPPLIAALQHENVDVLIAAANALSQVGTAAAVLPLKEAAERSPDPELRRAMRQAIAAIQTRLPGASPGQLSLAGSEVGQLSLAQAEAGQLSLATDPAGQLSLAEHEARQPSLTGAGEDLPGRGQPSARRH